MVKLVDGGPQGQICCTLGAVKSAKELFTYHLAEQRGLEAVKVRGADDRWQVLAGLIIH